MLSLNLLIVCYSYSPTTNLLVVLKNVWIVDFLQKNCLVRTEHIYFGVLPRFFFLSVHALRKPGKKTAFRRDHRHRAEVLRTRVYAAAVRVVCPLLLFFQRLPGKEGYAITHNSGRHYHTLFSGITRVYTTLVHSALYRV